MDFAAVSQRYAEHSADARGLVRHELVERRLLAEAATLPKQTVLDVGCGDGEMSLRLARRGLEVLGVDESQQMISRARARLASEPASVRRRVSFEQGAVDSTCSLGTFGLVCCHGVLLYLPESGAALAALAASCQAGSVLSVLTKNSLAIGMRPALAGRYAEALDEIRHQRVSSPGNLGIITRGDDPNELNLLLSDLGFTVLPWQGVRAFCDHLPAGTVEPQALADLIALEEFVSWRDPYRGVARLVHVLGRR